MKSKYLKRAIILLKVNETLLFLSDLVLTTKDNHFVGIKIYDAPYITAKGNKKQLILLKKKSRHKIDFYENDRIAKALYTDFLTGDEIPEKFYSSSTLFMLHMFEAIIKKQQIER